jgi:glycosyltransferase involved in cell wall biosynthesis
LAGAKKNLKITELGAYSRDNVFDLMTTVDWVVMPSVWPETFGLVVSEAWDAKRPVISARAGGLTDRINHGVDGFLFQPGSATQLAALMQDCVGNDTLWQTLSDGVTDEVSMQQVWDAHKDIMRLTGATDH